MSEEIKDAVSEDDAAEEMVDEQAELEEQLQAEADAVRRTELKNTVKKELKEWAVALVTALVVVLVVRAFLFTVIRVDGNSMHPTLLNNERLLVTVSMRKWAISTAATWLSAIIPIAAARFS